MRFIKFCVESPRDTMELVDSDIETGIFKIVGNGREYTVSGDTYRNGFLANTLSPEGNKVRVKYIFFGKDIIGVWAEQCASGATYEWDFHSEGLS